MFFLSALPLPCLSGCLCYYSVDHRVNTVNCSYNNMTTLPAKLLPRTELLIMKGNNLGNLDFIPENFPKINELDLNRSRITTISDEVLKVFLQRTDKLCLTSNKLKEVPSLLQVQKMHTVLCISDNPFECSCDMMWMRDWLLNATNIVEKEKIVCASGKWKGMLANNLLPFFNLIICIEFLTDHTLPPQSFHKSFWAVLL